MLLSTMLKWYGAQVRLAHYIIYWTSSHIPVLPHELYKRCYIQCTFNFSEDGRASREIMGHT